MTTGSSMGRFSPVVAMRPRRFVRRTITGKKPLVITGQYLGIVLVSRRLVILGRGRNLSRCQDLSIDWTFRNEGEINPNGDSFQRFRSLSLGLFPNAVERTCMYRTMSNHCSSRVLPLQQHQSSSQWHSVGTLNRSAPLAQEKARPGPSSVV